jgi:signal transduction histidine kinase
VAAAGAAGIVVAVLRLVHAPPFALAAVAAVALAVTVADRFTLSLFHGGGSEHFALTDAVWVAAIVLAHPGVATAGASLGALAWQLHRRLPAAKIAFGVGQVALSLSLAELVWSLATPAPDPARLAAWALVAAAAAAAFAVNATTVALVIALVRRGPFRAVALGSLRVGVLQWAGSVAIGVLACIAWNAHPLGILLVAVPLGLLYLADREWVAGLVEREQMEDLARTAEQIARHGDTSRQLPHVAEEGRLAQLTTSLNRMLAEIDGALGREQHLMREAAEELQAPVRAIRGELARCAEEGTPPRPRVRLELDRLERVLDDMAAVAGAGHPGALRPVPVELGRVLDAVAERARPLLGDRLEVTRAPDDAIARLDRRWSERALLHLLRNAAVHGRPTSRVELRAVRVPLGWRLEVADQGGGLPPGHEEAVFEPFYRLASGHEGSGLGLALVRSVAEAHGGSAGVHNRPGVGVTFWMRVPG